MEEKIGIIGLGYVGLPVALAFARKFSHAVGFDIDRRRVETLAGGVDSTGETPAAELRESTLQFSSREEDLKGCTFFVVAVPTPVDENHNPDLGACVGASELVGRVIQPGAVVVFESTVYPGVTEDICGPAIERVSKLKCGKDFFLGYSPERINPGDREHTLERIIKVVSGQDERTLDRVARAYGSFVEAGVHRAPSIKVAEAAKVIENTQRDLNIALMNELSIIFDRMGISTRAVLDAAGTKWNFLRFMPGLVGGHCIGVDPYYLTTKAEQLGYHPQVILAGRRINDQMGVFIAQKAVKMMVHAGLQIKGSKIGILGITFKENVSDTRNSRVPDIATELKQFGCEVLVHDPVADSEVAAEHYGIQLAEWEMLNELDGCIVAVSHSEYLDQGIEKICSRIKKNGVLVDVKSLFSRAAVRPDIGYWSL